MTFIELAINRKLKTVLKFGALTPTELSNKITCVDFTKKCPIAFGTESRTFRHTRAK